MTSAEAIETLRANYPDACFEQLKEAVEMAINALTAQTEYTEQDVKDAYHTGFSVGMEAAQAERKKGKWTRITQGAMSEQYMCPFCHRTVESYGVEELLSVRFPYCHCGADMRGEQEE